MDTQWVTFGRMGTADVVRLAGEIDLANVSAIGEQITTRTASASSVLIDLTAVSFLDSAGVRLLDTLIATLAERATATRVVVGESSAVRMTLRICAFRRDLLDADLATAAAALR